MTTKFLLPSLLLLLVACDSAEKKQNTNEKAKSENELPATDSTWAVDFPDGTYFYSGLINHKYAFHMQLNVKASRVNGFYFYDSERKELNLMGYIDQGKLELDETYKDKITGHFVSTTLTTDSIAGNWLSAKGKKMDFALYQSSQKDYELSLTDSLQPWTQKDFMKLAHKFDQFAFPFKYAPLPLDDDAIEKKRFTDEEMKLFINPEFDPGQYIHPRYYYGFKYETPGFIALVFTEQYVPGAFGIYNSSLVMRTFTLEGKLISEKYLGCNCYDNNMSDYYQTSEEFYFTPGEITITGTEVYASQEYMETEDPEFKPFREEKPIKRKITISEDGEIRQSD